MVAVPSSGVDHIAAQAQRINGRNSLNMTNNTSMQNSGAVGAHQQTFMPARESVSVLDGQMNQIHDQMQGMSLNKHDNHLSGQIKQKQSR